MSAFGSKADVTIALAKCPLMTQSGHCSAPLPFGRFKPVRCSRLNLSGDGASMRRRDFIILIGGAASWPLAARAQPAERMRRIGVLLQATKSDLEFQPRLKAFLDGLAQFGWTEGRNLQLEYRWA
jgi:hypothetical protein